jgi:hypothetical protein
MISRLFMVGESESAVIGVFCTATTSAPHRGCGCTRSHEAPAGAS